MNKRMDRVWGEGKFDTPGLSDARRSYQKGLLITRPTWRQVLDE